ncbi:MAG: type II toxin-antitoxin system Phd/YefM family antitoxin [Chloroflexi bacterium]|nr:type II toxin-antitoxin system Phd/YefM family antitoxin [Chloroflexota bacterium]
MVGLLVRRSGRVKSLPLSEAKTNLSRLVDEVARRGERVTITKHGRPAALLVSLDDIESLEETLAIMSDREFYEDVRRGIRELGSGKARMISLDDLDENFELKKGRGRSRRGR